MSTQDKIKVWVNSGVKNSDTFYSHLYPNQKFLALGIDGQTIIACSEANPDLRKRFSIKDTNLYKKEEDFKGVNPFVDCPIRFTNFDIDSILSMIGFSRRTLKTAADNEMSYVNFNPYFIIDGKKEFYQRGYVWTLEQKQALIQTIYRGLEAGRIIVHLHSFKEQERMIDSGFLDFASKDIVDGKQRLSTVISFINDEFPDEGGNYYSELSESAQRRFGNYSGFSYGEMGENCSYEQIIDVFLNNTISGTPVSIEHIEYMVKLKKMYATT